MKTNFLKLSLLTSVFLLVPLAQADTALMASRVGAMDEQGTSEFYKTVFKMKEVNRIDLGAGHVEIMLNFGETEAAALGNSNAQIVIMHRETDAVAEAIPHLVFSVTDMDGVVASLVAAGAGVVREPFEYGKSGIKIAMYTDPSGNQLELIQMP